MTLDIDSLERSLRARKWHHSDTEYLSKSIGIFLSVLDDMREYEKILGIEFDIAMSDDFDQSSRQHSKTKEKIKKLRNRIDKTKRELYALEDSVHQEVLKRLSCIGLRISKKSLATSGISLMDKRPKAFAGTPREDV